jgi:nucleotide-binding universal stress UspA family protein
MRYLVAIDGSEESREALTLAAAHADAMDARLNVVRSVIPEIQSVDGEQMIESADEATDRGQRVLDAADEVLGNAVEFDTELVYGHPVDEIPAYAGANDIDHIFVGHRGLSEKQEELVGSVAKQVVDRATVPVTVVR